MLGFLHHPRSGFWHFLPSFLTLPPLNRESNMKFWQVYLDHRLWVTFLALMFILATPCFAPHVPASLGWPASWMQQVLSGFWVLPSCLLLLQDHTCPLFTSWALLVGWDAAEIQAGNIPWYFGFDAQFVGSLPSHFKELILLHWDDLFTLSSNRLWALKTGIVYLFTSCLPS